MNNEFPESVLHSSFADDPVMSELAEMYASEMPEKIQGLETLAQAEQWEELRRTAHQLKGSGKSYGFEPISSQAAQLENSLKSEQPEEAVLKALQDLLSIMRRVR